MADNLELALRIRADLNSALRGLDQMEGGVDKRAPAHEGYHPLPGSRRRRHR